MGVSIYEVAALSSGTGDVTPAIPTHGDADNWWLYLVVQTAAEFTTLSSGGHASDPKLGFVELVAARTSTGTPGAAGSVGLQLFRYQLNNAGTLGTAPTIADAGDHIIAFMFSARDHWTGGDPLDALATSVQATATTSATGPGVTTQVNDATLLCIIANATDTATTQGSSASNADLSFVGFEAHRQDVAGAGGGVEIIGGVDTTAGTVGAFAMTLATSSATAAITISLAATSTPGVGGGGYTLAADPGSYALTGTAAGLKVTHRLVADAGSYAVTGTNATLSTQTSLSLLGVFSASMIPALWWDRTLSPYAWFTIEAATTPAAPGSYTLTADPGSYALTGTAAGLRASRILGAGAGSYTLTGVNATISRVLALGAGAGSYALTGADVGFRRALRLVAGSGSYALTGTDATLSVPGSLDLGDHGIDFQIYGSASRDAAITLDTQASGSIVIVSAGGLFTDVNSAFTDNKSNTIQKIGSTTAYTDWGSTYGVSLARTKPPMTGGTSHTFTVPVTLFSESTAFAIEVIGGGRIVGHSWINTSNTGAGATVTSDPVTAYEPVVWISFWWGAHPVFSPDTTPFQASAAGSGFTDLESYLINNSSGEVQAASAALVDNTPSVSSPVTKTVTWSHYPSQGAQVILIAVAAPAQLTASDGSYAITGPDVTLRRTYNLIAGAGSYALTGSSVALRLAKTIGAGAGSYAVTGSTAGLRVTRRLSCEAGSYATTGTDVALQLTRAVVAAPGSYATTGTAARLLVAHRLTAGAGSYATTGTAANLARTLWLVAGAGSYALTGTAAALRASRVLVAAAGAYAWTGAGVGLVRSARLAADSGSFTLAGSPATMRIVRALTADPGSYVISGSAAGLLIARALVAGAGSYESAGSDVGLRVNRRFDVGAGAYIVDGASAGLFLTYRVVLQAGAFELTGFDVALTVSGGLVALPNGIQATRATARVSVTRATAAASAVRSTPRTDTARTTSTAAATRTTARATVERTT